MLYHNSVSVCMSVLLYVCMCVSVFVWRERVSKVSGIFSKQLVQCEMSIKIYLSTSLHHSVHIPDDLQLYN